MEKQPDLETQIDTLLTGFCVDALALSVFERQISRDKAADLICSWFPENLSAIEGLYRRVHDYTRQPWQH